MKDEEQREHSLGWESKENNLILHDQHISKILNLQDNINDIDQQNENNSHIALDSK